MLPYLEVQKQQTEEDIKEVVEMPSVIDLNITEANKILKELGLEVEVSGQGEKVTDQLPKHGIQINSGTKVTIYADEN